MTAVASGATELERHRQCGDGDSQPSVVALTVLSSRLDFASERALPALVVPLFNPRIRAQIAVHVLKVLAHLVALALHLLAAVKVQIALVAVLGLVYVREARIEGSRLQWERTGCCWGHSSDSTQVKGTLQTLTGETKQIGLRISILTGCGDAQITGNLCMVRRNTQNMET